jgi:hypothetical protein
MEMDMQDPGEMWGGIEMLVPPLSDRDRGRRADSW